MSRGLHQLSARQVATLRKPGRHADGGNLYAAISKNGRSRRWVFLYRWEGKRYEMGLGSLDAVSLADARKKAASCRMELSCNRSPLEQKREAATSQRQEVASKRLGASGSTFGAVAIEFLSLRERAWRNDKHKAQWRMTLQVYAAPLWRLPVADVSTDDVLEVLAPIWNAKPETASRTRGRIEAVIDAARVRGIVDPSHPNPARWRGHLDNLLPARPKHTRGHLAAMPWQEVPQFVARLRLRPASAARALEYCILTAARIGEVRGMRWDEIDLKNRLWIVPATRMKNGKQHRVPLSDAAADILKSLTRTGAMQLVFPGSRSGRPMSNMVMKALYKRMGLANITTHGFRSSFRDWAGDATLHSREVCEAALAHSLGSAVELAYRRADALEKRRELMDDWAKFLATESSKD